MYKYLICSIIIFTLIAVFVQGPGISDLIVALLSVASFLFGIFLAFAVANRQARFNSIRTALRRDDAMLLTIYKLSSSFGPEVQNKCRGLIDDFLISAIDYDLVDYEESVVKFNKLFDFFVETEPKTESQKIAYDNILYTLKESSINKKEVIHWVRERMLIFEWGSLLILGAVILSSIFIINNKSIVSVFTSVLLGTSLVLLLLILRSLDDLHWKEGSWIWDPLARLFLELDLSPYVSKDVLDEKRVKLKKGITYRVAECPNPYPDFSGKKINLIKN